jgi:hypothetical protein
MKLEYLGKRWTGNTLIGQTSVSKVISESWAKITALLYQVENENLTLPVTRNRVRSIRLLMRRARSLAFTDHAGFFIAYGQIVGHLKPILEEYYRRMSLKAKLGDRLTDEGASLG